MGFTDPQELLTAIRHFTAPSAGDTNRHHNAAADAAALTPTPIQIPIPTLLVNSEQVMIWIITQREEAEEAKKMDEARLRSESLRKEQAELQKRAAQERLDTAGLSDLKELFPGSWILKDSNNKLPLDAWVAAAATIKHSLVRLLTLEKQAIKFYGAKLPGGYFQQLCVRLEDKCSSNNKNNNNKKCSSSIQMDMKKECEILQTALYSLSEQQGGVPRIFLTASANINDDNDNNDDDSDDEIVIIHNSRASNATEVIEIE